jgi:hypothetical protein
MTAQLRRAVLAPVALLALLGTSSCATNHLLNWSAGEASIFHQPDNEVVRAIVVPGGTIAALPVTIVWDVATLPFQWIWGVHPYGGALEPDPTEPPT